VLMLDAGRRHVWHSQLGVADNVHHISSL